MSEIISNVPKTISSLWQERILKREFEIVLGKMLQSEQRHPEEEEGYCLRSANVQWDGVDVSDVKTMWFSPREKKDLQLRCGDLVVNEGGDVGRCAIWNGEIEACYFQNAINRVRPLRDASTRFLYYWLYNIKHAGYVDAIVTRTTIAHLTAEKLAMLPWPDVPPEQQLRIAAYLDASCTAIDAALKAKREQIEVLDALRAATLQRVITQGLNADGPMVETGNPWLQRIPAGWTLVQLKRIAQVHGGLTLGKSYEGLERLEYPYLRVANVQDGHVDLTDVSTLEVPPAVAAGVMLRAGDVLMTEGGDLDKLGRGTVWAGQLAPCLHQNHIFAVRCIEHKVLPHFLAYVTASRYGRDYFEATGKRTTNLAATNATKVGSFYVPLPSLKEQKALVDHLDAEIGRLKAIQDVISKQIDTLTAYRKSLIHECVTGQRRITEEELARVQAGRSALPTTPR